MNSERRVRAKKAFVTAGQHVQTGVRIRSNLSALRLDKPAGDLSAKKAHSARNRSRVPEEAQSSQYKASEGYAQEAHSTPRKPRISEDGELETARSGKFKQLVKKTAEQNLVVKSLAEPVLSPAALLLNKHPLFQGTRKDFRNHILPHLKLHTIQAMPDPSKDNHRLQTLDMLFDPLSLDPGPKVLMRQGEILPASHRGLLLVDTDSASALEVLHNDVLLAQDGGFSLLNFALGQEVIFNISETCLFTIQMRCLPRGGFYFIDADRLNLALNEFPPEQDIIVGRARDMACSVIHTWTLQFGSKCIPRLFCNVSPDFISSFMLAIEVRVYRAGAFLAQEGQPADACIYLCSGEANVTIKGSQLTRLTSDRTRTDIFSSPFARPAASWENWWGTLEAGGTCIEQTASVKACSDCIVWALSAEDLEQLREKFPSESGLIDRIAVKHLKLISPYLTSVTNISLFSDCSAGFVEALSESFKHKIYQRGENIVKEGDEGDEMFVLMHGKCSVLRSSSIEPASRLHPGSCFGGLAILDVMRLSSVTIRADTLCDVRVLNRPSLLHALQKYPEEEARITELVEAHSESRKAASTALEKASAGEGGFSDDFIRCLVEHMYEQPFMMRQVILQQGEEGMNLVVLVHGSVEIEANNIRIAEVEAPAIFGERGLLHAGSRSGATVRSMTVAECMLLPLNHSSIPDIKQFYAEDMRKLSSMLNKKMSATKKSLTGVGELDKGQGDQSLGFLMKDCSPEFLSQISSIFEKQVFPAGTTMITEGMEADLGFIIHQGTATISVANEETGRIGPGEFIGEFVILGASLMSNATVRADNKVVAFSIKSQAFQEVLSNFPEDKRKLHETMRQRILGQGLSRRGSHQPSQERQLLINTLAVSKVLGIRRTHVRKSALDLSLLASRRSLPGYREGLRWAAKRKKAIESAKVLKELREFPDPLSTTESFRPPEDGIGTPWSTVKSSGFLGMRMNKSRAVYGRRVWSECGQSVKQVLSSSSEESDKEATSSEESDKDDQNDDAPIIHAAAIAVAPESAPTVAACVPTKSFFMGKKSMKEQMFELRLEESKRAADEMWAKRNSQHQIPSAIADADAFEREPDDEFMALRMISRESILHRQSLLENIAQDLVGSGAVDDDDDDHDDYGDADDTGVDGTGRSTTRDEGVPSSLQGSNEKQDTEHWAEVSIDPIDIDTRSNSPGSSAVERVLDEGVASSLQGSNEKQDTEHRAEVSIDPIDIDTRSNTPGSSAVERVFDEGVASSLQGSNEKQDTEHRVEVSIDPIDIDTRSNSPGSSADIDIDVARSLVNIFGTVL